MAVGFGRVLVELMIRFDIKSFVLVANAVAELISRKAGVTGPVGQPNPA